MAFLWIAEYQSMANVPNSSAQMPVEPPLTTQKIAIGVAHAESALLQAGTRFVCVATDTACSIAYGTSPVATTTDRRRPAGLTEYAAVPEGGTFMLSVIANP
jgi:hypothetical protein